MPQSAAKIAWTDVTIRFGRQTVLDGAKKGFEVHLLLDATRAIDSEPGDRDKALEEMKNAGAIIEEGRTP